MALWAQIVPLYIADVQQLRIHVKMEPLVPEVIIIITIIILSAIMITFLIIDKNFLGLGSNPMGCSCAPGFTGQNCTTAITACDPSVNPCKNGATCSLSNGLSGTAVCTCTSGYTGTFCDQCRSFFICFLNITCPLKVLYDHYFQTVTATNPCLTANCNFGTCAINSSVAGGYQCVCNTGYSGAACTTCKFRIFEFRR